MNGKKKRKKLIAVLVVIVLLVMAVPAVVMYIGKSFTAKETEVRTDWTMDVGDVIDRNEEMQVEYAEAELGDGIRALQLVPMDMEEEGFTYYDISVQDRLEGALEALKYNGMEWTAERPLAVLNPYGTGSNGLYLYFETEGNREVSYTIHVEDETIPDFTRTAAEDGESSYSKSHEIQIIGLVPGMKNEVTLTLSGSWGNVRQTVHFTVDMPETQSGYPVQLEYTDGDSDAEPAEGLYTMMRINGHLGYSFFFDDEGVLRYEMVLEGYGPDRILFDGDDIITCVSSGKLARINGIGQVEQVYELDGYVLHHDIGFGREGEILALAEVEGAENVEDQLISIDMESGKVTCLIDFTETMSGYYEMTRPIRATDTFFWQAGEWDWIHLNSLEYLEEEDSLIVSSRETSAIIKLEHIHEDPEVSWIAGDSRFWEDTPYAEYCLEQEGDFVPQYGQHCVEYLRAGEEEGVYYLSLYNNNYWCLNSRDDFEMDVAETVGTDLYGLGSETSQVYVYRIDENAGTFSLEESFDVPYSSIVSNGSPCGTEGNWIVNSGVSKVFGEYDADGVLIREFAYECDMQNYRTFKYDYKGFWFG